jgi:ribosomal protein S12 methylthiotransferase accessory factor
MYQLDSIYDSSALLAELKQQTKLVHRDRGSRRQAARTTLTRLRGSLRAAGIVRLSDISYLAPDGYPVFQTTRPTVYSHSFLGQNTGSQGGGATRGQAQIAAVMESLEDFSAEPRNAGLIRGSYRSLRNQWRLLPPTAYVHARSVEQPPSLDEPLVWTPALSLELERDVLAPAEIVHFAFAPSDYDTRPIFPSSSNGLAGGTSRVEAALHGLYELLERHHFAIWNIAPEQLDVQRVRSADLERVPGYRALRDANPDLRAVVLVLRFVHMRRHLPTIMTVLLDPKAEAYHGSRVHPDARIAIGKAVGEAIQSRATQYSAAREDIALRRMTGLLETPESLAACLALPETIGLAEIERTAAPIARNSLQRELQDVVEWVHRLGFGHVLVKDLTRVGFDVPLVRVVVPGMRMQAPIGPWRWSLREKIQCQFSLDL